MKTVFQDNHSRIFVQFNLPVKPDTKKKKALAVGQKKNPKEISSLLSSLERSPEFFNWSEI